MLSVCCCTFRVFHALFIFGKAIEKAIPEGKNHRVIILDIRTALARRVRNENKIEFSSRKEKKCNEGSSRGAAGRILKIEKEKNKEREGGSITLLQYKCRKGDTNSVANRFDLFESH